MKKFVLAYNPVAGNGMFRKKLDRLIAMFQKYECMLVPYRTSRDNKNFAEFVREVMPTGLIIAGGDGTLSEMVNIMLENGIKIPIAIIASGTSNDFASCMELDDGDFSEYIKSIIIGKTSVIDVGMVDGKYFVNVASAGMLTSVAHVVDRRLKNTFGKLAYYLRGIGELPRFRALSMTIEADGIVKHVNAFFVLVVNSSVVAGVKNISVKAKLNDGKLDLIMLKQCRLPDLVTFTAETVAGKSIINNKNIEYIQASSFKISCEEEVQSDIDGEFGPRLPLEIKAVPSAMEVYIK